jgi:predicted aspartyl protease
VSRRPRDDPVVGAGASPHGRHRSKLAVMGSSVRGLAGCLVVALGGCALPAWIGHRPMFPTGSATSWEIPLYEPLTGLGPKVLGTVCGAAQAGKPRVCEDVLLYVDSGSSHSALPAETFARLGVVTEGSRFATIENAAGEKRAWSGGLIPELRLGELALRDVVAMVDKRTAILGADVLTANGWRIDPDRGSLVLGPSPASPAAGAARLPIRGYPARTIVDLTVQGRVVPVMLDTGAPFTVVDTEWLKAAGLPLRRLNHGWPLGERDPSVRLGDATDADLRLGDLDLGRRQLVGHPRMPEGPERGLLGLDMLSEYAFGVSAGALDVVRRAASPLATTSDRVARWRDLPSCPGVPGCVAAQLEPGGDVRVRFRVVASSRRAQRYVFGCVDDAGRLRDSPVWVEIGMRAPAAGEERVVEIKMPEPLRPLFRRGCAGLALLDVNPVLSTVRPMTADVEARFVFAFRRGHLD